MYYRIFVIGSAISLFAPFLRCQSEPAPDPAAQTNNTVPHADKHVLGIIPNFRTAALPVPYQPSSTGGLLLSPLYSRGKACSITTIAPSGTEWKAIRNTLAEPMPTSRSAIT